MGGSGSIWGTGWRRRSDVGGNAGRGRGSTHGRRSSPRGRRGRGRGLATELWGRGGHRSGSLEEKKKKKQPSASERSDPVKQVSVRSCTGQPGVDPVVLVPQPHNLLLSALHAVHAGGRRLFKVSTTLLAAEERPNIATHHLQHRRRLALQTCATHTQTRLSTLLIFMFLCCLSKRKNAVKKRRYNHTEQFYVPVLSRAVGVASCWTVRT